MYDAFYGLKRRPFSPLPDPSFFYLGRIQQEAIRLIESALKAPSGWILIIGEPGSGKTTLARYLLGRLKGWAIGLMSYARPSPEPVLLGVRHRVNAKALSSDPSIQQQRLSEILISETGKGRPALLMIDAAQGLTPDGLSELIRIESRGGLRLILLGRLELRAQLAQGGCEGFMQRLVAFYQLGPLEPNEIGPYIQHRLRLAGAAVQVFSPEAYRAIFEHSRGLPRLINLICERALTLAEGRGLRSIDRQLIESVAQADGVRVGDPGSAKTGLVLERPGQTDPTPQLGQADPVPAALARPTNPRPAQGLPEGLNLIEGDRPWVRRGRQTPVRPWQLAAFGGLLVLGGAVGWSIYQEALKGQGVWFEPPLIEPGPGPSAEPVAEQGDQGGQQAEPASDQPLFDDLIRLAQEPIGSPALVRPAISAAPAGSEPALERLARQLTELGIPIEWRAPNRLRADLTPRIQFREGSRALDEPARTLLARLAALLEAEPAIRLHITTHTDTRGSRANNQVLSERRAADIALVLRRNGIEGSRLSYEGKGSSEPKFSPEEERRLGPWINRRVEIDLILIR